MNSRTIDTHKISNAFDDVMCVAIAMVGVRNSDIQCYTVVLYSGVYCALYTPRYTTAVLVQSGIQWWYTVAIQRVINRWCTVYTVMYTVVICSGVHCGDVGGDK